MPGFMSGFGDAFARSYGQSRQISAQKEQDSIRMTWDAYTRRQDKFDTWQREDAKAVRGAKTLAQAYGLPAEAWSKIYELQQSGMDPEKMLANGEFEVVNNGADKPASAPAAQNAAEAASPELHSRSGMEPDRDPSGTITNVAGAKGADTMAGAGGNDPSIAGAGGIPQAGQGEFPPAPGGADSAQGASPVQAAGADAQADLTKDTRYMKSIDKVAQMAGVDAESVRKTLQEDYKSPLEQLPGSTGVSIRYKPKTKAEVVNTVEEAMMGEMTANEKGDKGLAESFRQRKEALMNWETVKAKRAADLKAKAEGTYSPNNIAAIFDKDGKFQEMAPVTDGEDGQKVNAVTGTPISGKAVNLNKSAVEEFMKISASFDKPKKEYLDQVSNYGNALRGYANLTDIATKNPNVLGRVGKIEQYGTGIVRDVMAGMDAVVGEAKAQGYTPKGLEMLSQQEEKLQQAIGGNIADDASAMALFDAQANLFAYRLALSAQAGDKKVSNQDFDKFKEMVVGKPGIDINTFKQNLSQLMRDQKSSVEASGKSLGEQNGSIDGFYQVYKFNPFTMPPTLDEYISQSSDEGAKAGWALMNGTAPDAPPAPGTGLDTAGPNIAPVTVKSEEEFLKLPKGTVAIGPNGTKMIAPGPQEVK